MPSDAKKQRDKAKQAASKAAKSSKKPSQNSKPDDNDKNSILKGSSSVESKITDGISIFFINYIPIHLKFLKLALGVDGELDHVTQILHDVELENAKARSCAGFNYHLMKKTNSFMLTTFRSANVAATKCEFEDRATDNHLWVSDYFLLISRSNF